MMSMSARLGGGVFGRTLRLELRRAVYSPRFLLGVGLTLVWMAFNAAEAVGSYPNAVFAGIPVLLRLAITGQLSTGPVLLAVATIPHAFSYLAERECGFQQQAISRVGSVTYARCKSIAIFLSAFLMGAVAIATFIVIASIIGIPHTVRYDEVEHTYAVLAATMGPGWYYAIKIFHIGMVCGQAAVFSLLIMTWVPNSYVCFLSPLIGYYLYECILSILSRFIYNPFFFRLISGDALFWGQAAANPLFSYLWTIYLLSFVTLCYSVCFMIRVEKELAK